MSFPQYRSLKIEPGLYLVEPRGGKTYQARCRVDGEWRYVGTDTADYQQAKQFAFKWFRQLRAGREGYETVQQAADAYFGSIRDEGKRTYHQTTFKATQQYWQPGMGRPSVVVADVDTPKLLEFVRWRQAQSPRGRSLNPRITSNTLHKDLVTLRQILKYAVARGVIERVPEFPGAHVVGSIESNPQPWLTRDEWQHLMQVAAERIDDAADARTRARRQELRDFCEFMWLTGLRVDEARSLQLRDVTVKHTKPIPQGQVPREASMPRETRGMRNERFVYRMVSSSEAAVSIKLPFLEIRVRKSKTGPRVCQSRAHADALFGRMSKDKAPTDLLFSETHRDAFRELLIAADLRINHYGHPRNSKCLRPTAISHWLLDKPTIPLSWLATNCGTSIQMLQDFYIKRLGLALDGSAWQ